MKSKFSIIDLCAVIHDLRALISMRVVNVYDINSETYIIKLEKRNQKAFILFESGIRIHRTSYDWPKSTFPSRFSMKFCKHINQKRLTGVSQVGMDRIIDLEFGEERRCCHVIFELCGRGNVVLTDNKYIILNILRRGMDADTDVKVSVRKRYSLENARQKKHLPSLENIRLFLENGKKGDVLKWALVRHAPFSSLLLEHALISVGLPSNAQIGVHVSGKEDDVQLVHQALMLAHSVFRSVNEKPCAGYLAYTSTTRDDGKTMDSYQEYYPVDFAQFRQPGSKFQILELPCFSDAVDKFYSSIDAQKAEQRVSNAEKVKQHKQKTAFYKPHKLDEHMEDNEEEGDRHSAEEPPEEMWYESRKHPLIVHEDFSNGREEGFIVKDDINYKARPVKGYGDWFLKKHSVSKNLKKQEALRKQKTAAQKALKCPVCMSKMPDAKSFRIHFKSKHPKKRLPSELEDIPK